MSGRRPGKRREFMGTCSNCRAKQVVVRKVRGSQCCKPCFTRFEVYANKTAWLCRRLTKAESKR